VSSNFPSFFYLTANKYVQANLQMGFINLECDTSLKRNFSETKLQDFNAYLTKEKVPCAQILWVKNDRNVWQHLCI
jgi:hypothetical protein